MNQQSERDIKRRACKLGAIGVALFATILPPAHADDVRFDELSSASPTPSDVHTAGKALLGAAPLADDVLSGRRGGASAQNDMRLDGVVGSNEATNVVTGSNTVSSGAFAGTAGLPMVIQNSGNNVLIQNATIVNVQIK